MNADQSNSNQHHSLQHGVCHAPALEYQSNKNYSSEITFDEQGSNTEIAVNSHVIYSKAVECAQEVHFCRTTDM